MEIDQFGLKNALLLALSEADFAQLARSLTPVDLPRSQELMFPGQEIEYCWFLEDGVASVVAATPNGQEAEAALVGREGFVDLAVILGMKKSPLRCFMQIPGNGYRLPSRVLAALYQTSPDARTLLNRFAFSMVIQIAQTALANASFSIEERLARWLLLCADRVADEDIAMTHEYLALMLNVRRAGVTIAMQSLHGAGLVKSGRGSIRITDRRGLEEFANDAYAALN